ncbi:MAG: FecR family protein [Gammaproteobacteria bacterium]|nr:FecR family protein [Gammaproteobacteria bacterium]
MKYFTPLIISVLLVLPTHAANEAGRAMFVAGAVTAERDEVVPLKRDDAVFESDVIVTAPRARAQLLMRDGAKFALRPDTRFQVIEYFQAGDEVEQPDGSVVVASDDSAVTELIKGGFRTITGAVGRDDAEDYEVRTPAATMGIRGTHYAVVWCAGDCQPPPGIETPAPNGLYVSVTEGRVFMANAVGELTIAAGQYAYVQDQDTPPRQVPAMPVPLIDVEATELADEESAAEEVRQASVAAGDDADDVGLPASSEPPTDSGFSARAATPPPDDPATGGTGSPGAPGDGSDSGDGSDGGDDAPSRQASRGGSGDGGQTGDPGGPDLLAPPYNSSTGGGFETTPEIPLNTEDGESITGGDVPDIRAVALARAQPFTASSPRGRRTFAGNDLGGFDAPPVNAAGTQSFYAIGSAQVRDDGFDPGTGMGWGRWSNGTATVTQGASSSNINLSGASLHWVYGPMLPTRPVMPTTGTATFRVIVGNTDPTDNSGNSGILGNASLMADFGALTVESSLQLGINGSNWSASGGGTIVNELFNGTYNVLIDNQLPGSGSFSGFFNSPAANGLPNGAGMTYGLSGPAGTTVNGAVVFGAPTAP